MDYYRIIFYLIVGLFCCSCSCTELSVKENHPTHVHSSSTYSGTFQLNFENSSIIELDAFSGIEHPIRGVTPNGEFYFFNKNVNAIYLYDLAVGKINHVKKKISVPIDPHQNFREVSELYFHNQDSIFIYDRSNEATEREDLILINAEGKILKKYPVLNFVQGDPIKFDRVNTYNGQTMYFHRGKVFLVLSYTAKTKEEFKKPLLAFDLQTSKREFIGEFPWKPDFPYYGQYTTSTFSTFDLHNEKLYFSRAFHEDLFEYRINTGDWLTIAMQTGNYEQPRIPDKSEDIRGFVRSHDWFKGLYFDSPSGNLLRFLFHKDGMEKQRALKPITDVEGIKITGSDQVTSTYLINTETLETVIVPHLNMWRIYLFHPTLGPMINAQSHPDFTDLDVEDYLILSPVQILKNL